MKISMAKGIPIILAATLAHATPERAGPLPQPPSETRDQDLDRRKADYLARLEGISDCIEAATNAETVHACSGDAPVPQLWPHLPPDELRDRIELEYVKEWDLWRLGLLTKCAKAANDTNALNDCRREERRDRERHQKAIEMLLGAPLWQAREQELVDDNPPLR